MLRNTPGEYSSDNGEKSQKSDGDTTFSKKWLQSWLLRKCRQCFAAILASTALTTATRKIRTSEIASQFTAKRDYRADFWEIADHVAQRSRRVQLRQRRRRGHSQTAEFARWHVLPGLAGGHSQKSARYSNLRFEVPIYISKCQPHEKLLGIRRVSNPSTSIDPGSLKIGFLVIIQNAGFVWDNGTNWIKEGHRGRKPVSKKLLGWYTSYDVCTAGRYSQQPARYSICWIMWIQSWFLRIIRSASPARATASRAGGWGRAHDTHSIHLE